MKRKVIWLLNNWELCIASAAIVCLTSTAALNVFTRYILKHPFTWAEELECILLCWAAFPSAAVAYKKNLHYGLDVLMDHLSVTGQMVLRRIITFLCIFLFGFLAYLSFRFMGTTDKYTIFFRLSYRYIILSPALSFTNMAVWSVIFFVESFVRPKAFMERYVKSYDEESAVENQEPAAGPAAPDGKENVL